MSRAIDRAAYFQTEELPDRVHETRWQALPLVNTAAAIFDERKIRHNRPISAHFHSGGAKFAYFGEDLGESV
jgi:hypothetical protein